MHACSCAEIGALMSVNRLRLNRSMTIAVMGDSAVGKTSIIRRWSTNTFTVDEYEPTLEDYTDSWVSADNILWRVRLIDTPGNEEFGLVRDAYITSCDAVVFVYDITQKDTFLHIRDRYWPQARRARNEDVVPCVLIGNKTDCVDSRQVTPREGESLAANMDTLVVEMSARLEEGRERANEALVTAVRRSEELKTARSSERETKKHRRQKGCGCIIT